MHLDSMFNLPGDTLDVPCPECRRLMVELAKLQNTAILDSVVGDSYTSARYSHGRIFLFFELLNTLLDSFLVAGRKRKIRRLCQEVLPAFPKTLICANCLFLYQRR